MKQRNIRQDERGFASIVIALILITVLALITVGITQLSNGEQQISLGKTLSDQAYYAADSGINDMVNYIDHNGTGPPLPADSAGCIDPAQFGLNPHIGDLYSGVDYTCIILYLKPASGLSPYIDVTGRARGVLKRLQATINIKNGNVQITGLTSLPPIL